jgi:hypothetical protein
VLTLQQPYLLHMLSKLTLIRPSIHRVILTAVLSITDAVSPTVRQHPPIVPILSSINLLHHPSEVIHALLPLSMKYMTHPHPFVHNAVAEIDSAATDTDVEHTNTYDIHMIQTWIVASPYTGRGYNNSIDLIPFIQLQ